MGTSKVVSGCQFVKVQKLQRSIAEQRVIQGRTLDVGHI